MRVLKVRWRWIAILFIGLISASLTQAEQTSYNRHTARLTRLLTLDFEEGNLDWASEPGSLFNATLTSDAAEVLAGNYSLKLTKGGAIFRVPPSKLVLDPNKTYVVEYKYRLSDSSSIGYAGVIFVDSQDRPIFAFPLTAVDSQTSGPGFGGLTLNSQSGVSLILYSHDVEMVVDDVIVYRQDTDVSLAHVPLWTVPFPRLANYMTSTPARVAEGSGVSESMVEQMLARYDVVTGLTIDPTMGDGNWTLRLQQLNPGLRIMPYRQSFVAQDLGNQVIGGTSNLQGLFNAGLDDRWFMKDPAGNRLHEPDYPGNYQLNHTRYSPLVNNRSFSDYMVDFLGSLLLPSGLFEGVHFDQPEWIPNPLLTPIAQGQEAPLPPIDLHGDGRAETTQTLYDAWYGAFFDYFQKVTDRLGFTQLLVGNPGYLSANPDTQRMLNGWVGEIASPYSIFPNGDWDTTVASGWYRLFFNYWLADAVGRAPQMAFIEATGMKLGRQTGGYTFNSWPQRVQEIEPRDYRRMRLGLTTALLANGFYEYDLVDNTSVPVWFDEYAVDPKGVATGNTTGKGYLGQPLGPAVELDYAFRTLFSVDFESPVDQSFLHLTPTARFTTDPNEVVSGSRSAVIAHSTTDAGMIFYTVPEENPLIEGRTYQLFMDFRVLSSTPTTYKGPVAVGLFSRSQGLNHELVASLYRADASGAGQSGTLRSSVRVVGAKDYMAIGALPDTGSVAVDNIRLVEGSGGMWRRDFENGIALVNPTPDAISVSLTEIQGPLHRTNIRRIRGSQVPSWNSGAPISSDGITIPSADGIILLANPIPYPNLTAPSIVAAAGSPAGAMIVWKNVPQYVAGYHVLYGEDPSALFQEAAAGREIPILQLRNLHPGALYYFKIAAFDFTGRIGPYSPAATFSVPGSVTRPAFTMTSPRGAIAPGLPITLEGADLSQVRVFINGVEVPILSSSSSRIEVQAPWEISGDKALIRVSRADGTYADSLVDLRSAAPTLLSAVAVWHVSGDFETNPSALTAGDVAVFLAKGLGRVEPPAQNGTLPARISAVTGRLGATVAGIPATVYQSTLNPTVLGQYYVVLSMPMEIPAGSQPIRLEVDGIPAESNFTFR